VPLLLPKGPADAAMMALELSRLLDEFQVQDISRDVLNDIVPDQLADYWALVAPLSHHRAGMVGTRSLPRMNEAGPDRAAQRADLRSGGSS
jgi:inactivated superfamily I helicase